MKLMKNEKERKIASIPFSEIGQMAMDLGFENESKEWDKKESGKRIAEKIELKLETRSKKRWSVSYSINETEKCFIFTAKASN